MNEFESVWTSLSQSFVQNGLNPRQAGFKLTAIIKFSQNGISEVLFEHRVRVEDSSVSRWLPVIKSESEWISEGVFESRMAVSESKDGRVQDGYISSSWVRMNEWSFFVEMLGTSLGKSEWVCENELRWLNPRWQNSRWLPSSKLIRLN